MEYTEKNDKVERVYEVTMDVDRLYELMTYLDRDCYVRRFGERVMEAPSEKEAIEKIEKLTNLGGLQVNEIYTLFPSRRDGSIVFVPYEAVYRDSVELVDYIKSFLRCYENNYDDCNYAMKSLIKYTESIDFYPFEKRVELAANKMQIDLGYIRNYMFSQAEAVLNKEYDFERLKELYQEVLKCFKLTLVEETRYYKSSKSCDLIMKLKM